MKSMARYVLVGAVLVVAGALVGWWVGVSQRQAPNERQAEAVAARPAAAVPVSQSGVAEVGQTCVVRPPDSSPTGGGQDGESMKLEEVSQTVVDEAAIRAKVAMEMRETEERQDAVMSRWPAYDQVREQIFEEVSAQYQPDRLALGDLVDAARELREQFWKEGGNGSAAAWRSGYKARVLVELAAQRAPDDLAVGDELVETLESVTPIYVADHRSGVWDTIKELREKQFEQTQAEITGGREPMIQDYVRCADLLFMVQSAPSKSQRSKEVLAYMQGMCDRKGWQRFEATLRRVQGVIDKQGCGYFPEVGGPRFEAVPGDASMGRRLPSFRGPAARGVLTLEEMK